MTGRRYFATGFQQLRSLAACQGDISLWHRDLTLAASKYERIINIPDGLYGGGFPDGYPDCTFVALVLEACSDTGADGLALLVPLVPLGALLLPLGGTFHPILPGFEPANVTGLEMSETCEAIEGYCLYEAVTHRICRRDLTHRYINICKLRRNSGV